jgi:hypothetical protein
MVWWMWLIVGIFGGFILAALSVAVGSYVITHNDRLMAWFSGRIMRTMMQGAAHKQEVGK